MLSIRSQSTVKYMLIGFVFLLLLVSVEALPTKNKHPAMKNRNTKHALGKSLPRAHGKAGIQAVIGGHQHPVAKASHKPSKGARSCPVHAPRAKLHKRADLTHPSAKNNIVLFHGTQNLEAAQSMAAKIDLSKTHVMGDFHHNRKYRCDGGAYFTDSIIPAAQFACHRDPLENLPVPEMVYVLEYKWTPGNLKVHEFKDWASVTDSQCKNYDMISGPMENATTDKSYTQHFWQYAVVNNNAVSGLAYVHTYTVYCAHVGPGKEKFTAGEYSQGQKENPEFEHLVSKLASKSASC